jgi:hypothetical protein
MLEYAERIIADSGMQRASESGQVSLPKAQNSVLHPATAAVLEDSAP